MYIPFYVFYSRHTYGDTLIVYANRSLSKYSQLNLLSNRSIVNYNTIVFCPIIHFPSSCFYLSTLIINAFIAVLCIMIISIVPSSSQCFRTTDTSCFLVYYFMNYCNYKHKSIILLYCRGRWFFIIVVLPLHRQHVF